MSTSGTRTPPGAILAGLSAHNEGKTVGRVAHAVSQGLRLIFPDRPKVLLLADSCSTDDTVCAFEQSSVEVTRIARRTEPDQPGKGRAVRLILEEAVARKAAAVILIDADLESLRPDWVERLATPVMEGYDLVEPLYLRGPRDGAVTSHFGHPIVVALAGVNIRQPTGGELALSGRLATHLLDRRWPEGSHGYGIDMFATLAAASQGMPIAAARLGVKIHRPNPAKLATIFCDVASTALAMAAECDFPLEDAPEVTEVPTFGEHIECCVPPGDIHVSSFLEVARFAWEETRAGEEMPLTAELRQHVSAALQWETPRVDVGLWHECLAQGVCAARSGADADAAARSLLTPFLARAATFWEEAQGYAPEEVENAIMSDALRFRGILRATPGAHIERRPNASDRSRARRKRRAPRMKARNKAKRRRAR